MKILFIIIIKDKTEDIDKEIKKNPQSKKRKLIGSILNSF